MTAGGGRVCCGSRGRRSSGSRGTCTTAGGGRVCCGSRGRRISGGARAFAVGGREGQTESPTVALLT